VNWMRLNERAKARERQRHQQVFARPGTRRSGRGRRRRSSARRCRSLPAGPRSPGRSARSGGPVVPPTEQWPLHPPGWVSGVPSMPSRCSYHCLHVSDTVDFRTIRRRVCSEYSARPVPAPGRHFTVREPPAATPVEPGLALEARSSHTNSTCPPPSGTWKGYTKSATRCYPEVLVEWPAGNAESGARASLSRPGPNVLGSDSSLEPVAALVEHNPGPPRTMELPSAAAI